MDLRQVWTLYVHEVRCALRERSIVTVSIVVPLVMYPAMLWALFAGMSFVQGQSERLTLRVALHGLPEAHLALGDSLRTADRIALVDWAGDPEEARDGVARGRLDAFVEVGPAGTEALALDENFQVTVTYSAARDRSRSARVQVESVVDSYRGAWLAEARRELGVPDPAWADFGLTRSDLATREEGTRFVLGLVVPFLTLIIVALSAFYPAIDATAGERERSTWETLMTVAAPRGSVAVAKYLYVATFGALGGLLNMTALVLSLRWILQPVGGNGGGELSPGGIPLGSLPVIGAGILLLALFVSAGMLVFAVFARNFKEGQAMLTPFYLVIVLPAFLVQAPDMGLTPALALVPVVNVALLIREGFAGSVPPLAGSIALVSMAGFVVLSIAFAQRVLRTEEVLLGSAGDGLGWFLKRRLAARRRKR